MRKTKIIIIAIFVILILAIFTSVYYLLREEAVNKYLTENQGDKRDHLCLSDNERADFKIERLGEYPNPDYDRGFAEIIVKDIETNQEISKFKIDNIINPSHYHPVELHKCGVYVIREFNFDPETRRSTPNYSGSLWKYNYRDYNKIEILKFSFTDSIGKYTSFYNDDFRIDPQEKYLVLEKGFLGKDDYSLVVKNLNTKEDIFILPAKSISEQYPNLVGDFDMLNWTKDGRYFWGNVGEGAYVKGFFRIDSQNWKTDIFEAPEGAMGGFPLNINTGYVPIQPGQIWTGDYQMTQELKEQYRKEGKKSLLYLYNLFTKEKILIETVDEPLFSFKSKWLSDIELEYELPTGEKKIYRIL